MALGRVLCAALLPCVWATAAQGQPCVHWMWEQDTAPAPAETVALTVPRGMVLQVALDSEVRVKDAGQPVRGLLVEAVYAFDREVIPAGSEVRGRITAIDGASGKTRFWAALNADFSPPSRVQVEFDEIVLPDGRQVPLRAAVTRGAGRPLELITTADNEKKEGVKDAAAERMKEAVRDAKRKWKSAMEQVKRPGRMRRLGRFAVAQLPVHPQYLDAGTVYFAELEEPLALGSAPAARQPAASGEDAPPPCNLLAHAQLVTPLSSATTQKDAPVEAVLSQPLFGSEQLLFPQGTILKGAVAQARPARSFRRNGTLRMVFNEVVLPDGFRREVDANLEGVQGSESQQVRIDREGGTKATTPKTRYLFTGIAVGLAVASYEDKDLEDGATDTRGNASQGAAGGAAGFKLIGILVGAFARSRPLALGMGIYGAARSGYSNFVARGQELEFPKGTGMKIGVWLSRECREEGKAER
ncbi:MAG: hypothetical protein ACRD4D_06385 [Candidatus Acidiferrales bacterium]